MKHDIRSKFGFIVAKADWNQTGAIASIRARTQAILDSTLIDNFILGVILFNAVVAGLQTIAPVVTVAGPLFPKLDTLCLSIFVVEITAKLFARGRDFFRKSWNIFDFIIIGTSLIPGSSGLSVLRALRILRLFRVLSVAPSLRRVVEGLFSALPGMASVFVLMAMMFYIGSVMATTLFGDAFPEWFGDLGRSGYTLFQIMTLESWSMGIVRPVMEVYPYAWMFFVPFILVTSFAVVNLLVGLIVNSMQTAYSEEEIAATDRYREEMIARLEKIEKTLQVRE
ncbi:ion transporter [uncultured Tateyamaria sp.]|uniref:ion transporter n=1 Tax=uncultured Tateyamaria sp. TaxID=455651 RepID=UPI002629C67C|nr:ion transporter [uncultured Tateyamaria sp.]